ncbi:MotA/TolQ/ExbB proton channel family protein [Virgibacillus pantothenticus]|uniref:MotA/TolQ/ExbB proton channel family protein n=1 Tax=Virgibacillus pantothenticus TaxID=1473 RepID=UPI000984C416|nr:MotA/TolQ/ExbB proton channel family protein [Virgibacillus pantothenticus]
MVEFILELFTTEQRVEAILSHPVIEFIFVILFAMFAVAVMIHFVIYNKLKRVRNYLKSTGRMDIDPLTGLKEQYATKQQQEMVKVETFVQEQFSNWRMFHIPVVSLIKMVQMTVSVFILIGVLGTFIGLTTSLSSINLEGNDIVSGVASVLAGIDVAFYTSIVGMGFSLVMTILLKVLNTEFMLTDIMLMTEIRLEGAEENGMQRLIAISEMINASIQHLQQTNQRSFETIEAAFAGFQNYTSSLEQSAENLAVFNDGLSDNLQSFQQLFTDMQEVTDGFATGTRSLNENFATLFTYFKRMDSHNERQMKAFEQTYERIKETTALQIDGFQSFEASVEDIKQFTSSLLDEQASMQHAFSTVNEKTKQLVAQMDLQNKEFKSIFGTDLSTKLTGIIQQLNELSREFDKMGDSLTQLPSALEVIHQTQAEYKHLLSDRFQELKEFNRTFSNHIKSHATNTMTFEKNMQEAASSFDQIAMKNGQLLQEINRTISQMTQSFQQRENQWDNSVHILKDTLANYVHNLEDSLGKRLEQIGQALQASMRETNEQTRNEWNELRRMADSAQQNQARVMQQSFQDLQREIQMLNQQLAAFTQRNYAQNNAIRLNQNEY